MTAGGPGQGSATPASRPGGLWAATFCGMPFSAVDAEAVLRLPRAAPPVGRPFGYIVTPTSTMSCATGRAVARCGAVYADADLPLCDSRILGLVAPVLPGVRLPVVTGSDLSRGPVRVHHQSLRAGHDRRRRRAGAWPGSSASYGLRNVRHHNPPMGFIRDRDAVLRGGAVRRAAALALRLPGGRARRSRRCWPVHQGPRPRDRHRALRRRLAPVPHRRPAAGALVDAARTGGVAAPAALGAAPAVAALPGRGSEDLPPRRGADAGTGRQAGAAGAGVDRDSHVPPGASAAPAARALRRPGRARAAGARDHRRRQHARGDRAAGRAAGRGGLAGRDPLRPRAPARHLARPQPRRGRGAGRPRRVHRRRRAALAGLAREPATAPSAPTAPTWCWARSARCSTGRPAAWSAVFRRFFTQTERRADRDAGQPAHALAARPGGPAATGRWRRTTRSWCKVALLRRRGAVRPAARLDRRRGHAVLHRAAPARPAHRLVQGGAGHRAGRRASG